MTRRFGRNVLFVVLLIGGAMIGCAVQVKECSFSERRRTVIAPTSTPPPVQSPVQSKASLTKEEEKELWENFHREIREAKDDVTAYGLLKSASHLLSVESQWIDLTEDVVENLEKFAEVDLGSKTVAKTELKELKNNLEAMKKKYAALTKVYNAKMISFDFKFANSNGLPLGEMEVLPRYFAFH